MVFKHEIKYYKEPEEIRKAALAEVAEWLETKSFTATDAVVVVYLSEEELELLKQGIIPEE